MACNAKENTTNQHILFLSEQDAPNNERNNVDKTHANNKEKGECNKQKVEDMKLEYQHSNDLGRGTIAKDQKDKISYKGMLNEITLLNIRSKSTTKCSVKFFNCKKQRSPYMAFEKTTNILKKQKSTCKPTFWEKYC